MIELRYHQGDLGRIRFARSPMQELVTSVRMLNDPDRATPHRRWLASAAPRIAALRVDILHALLGQPRYLPDFLFPPPQRANTEFPEELARVRETSATTVRAELDLLRGEKALPPVLRPLYDDPERGLGMVAGLLEAYWQAAIEPVWPRLRALLDADLGYRASQTATFGIAHVLAHLHHDLEITDSLLRIRWHSWQYSTDLRGNGLLLVPCVFAAPQLFVLFNEPYQPMLTYTPRGVGEVWADIRPTRSAPLAGLMGRSRAAMLARLDLPQTTTQLASSLGLTAPAVSQHLSVLRRAGLVTSRRAGRTVLYQRTALGSELLSAGSG